MGNQYLTTAYILLLCVELWYYISTRSKHHTSTVLITLFLYNRISYQLKINWVHRQQIILFLFICFSIYCSVVYKSKNYISAFLLLSFCNIRFVLSWEIVVQPQPDQLDCLLWPCLDMNTWRDWRFDIRMWPRLSILNT